MENSVKERLTGALIFVAAGIIILPEMLSGPDPQPAVTALAQPAESGPPLRTYSMTLNDSAVPRATVVPVPVAEVAPVVPPAVPQVAAAPQPAAASVAATTKPLVPEPAASSAGDWWLQVGIFGVRDNAEGLARKLRTAGFAIDLDHQVIGGKDRYRVRAGPVRDRTEALALQARLKASGDESRLLPP